jgi:hypothetical protein
MILDNLLEVAREATRGGPLFLRSLPRHGGEEDRRRADTAQPRGWLRPPSGASPPPTSHISFCQKKNLLNASLYSAPRRSSQPYAAPPPPRRIKKQGGSRGSGETAWWRRPAGLAAAAVGVVCALAVAAVASGVGDGSAVRTMLSNLGAAAEETCEGQVAAATR